VTDTPLRVVVLGYGYAAKTFHIPLIRATPGLELAAICSRHPEKIRADAPDVTATADAGEAMRLGDLVVVATPNETHGRLAADAIGAGRHVVVDKPLTVTLDEARAVSALAQARGRLVFTFHNRRWDSDFLAARALVGSGLLGGVTLYESHFDRFRPAVRDRWREKPGPGSGLWRDLGPHLVDQALQLFGLPERVTGHLARQRPGSAVDDWAHAVLDYGPMRALLHADLLVPGRPLRLVIHGFAGEWRKDGLDVQERQLIAGIPVDDAQFGVDPVRATWTDASGERVEMDVPRGEYRQFYLRVRDAIAGRGPNPVPPAQALAVVAVVQAVLESSAEGRTRDVPLTTAERSDFEHSRQPL